MPSPPGNAQASSWIPSNPAVKRALWFAGALSGASAVFNLAAAGVMRLLEARISAAGSEILEEMRRELLPRAQAMFDEIDVDNNGSLDLAEVRSFVNSYKTMAAQYVIDKLTKPFGVDRIDASTVLENRKLAGIDIGKKLFDQIDANGDGRVSREEFMAGLSQLDSKIFESVGALRRRTYSRSFIPAAVASGLVSYGCFWVSRQP